MPPMRSLPSSVRHFQQHWLHQGQAVLWLPAPCHAQRLHLDRALPWEAVQLISSAQMPRCCPASPQCLLPMPSGHPRGAQLYRPCPNIHLDQGHEHHSPVAARVRISSLQTQHSTPPIFRSEEPPRVSDLAQHPLQRPNHWSHRATGSAVEAHAFPQHLTEGAFWLEAAALHCPLLWCLPDAEPRIGRHSSQAALIPTGWLYPQGELVNGGPACWLRVA
mmetsp:Transcript_92029/g.269255  ORF Transcript_92029/g.269255 Transcript_92029/m.269255 type:complete len:219 (+) Transcript_92029:534-1190(+)